MASIPAAHHGWYPKRSYTFRLFIRDIVTVIRCGMTKMSTSISPGFAERIMLAVTGVNGCRYCSWIHTRLALEAGCSDREIAAILGSQFDGAERDELVALAFAQHYAETQGKPEKQAIQRLVHAYGVQKSKAILQCIYGITVGNYMGNTLDAFRSRLKKIPPEHGSLWVEFLVFLIGRPVVTAFGLLKLTGTGDVKTKPMTR
nr:carboxymuconolactone decarboxylase family protein [Candidatus Sigynarchaeota archaeon]